MKRPWLRRHAAPDGRDDRAVEVLLDVSNTTARNEIGRRVPWIVLALAAGALMVLIGRQFEELLARRLELALFIPMIVYMSDTIGTETLTLFVRALALKQVVLHQLFLREAGVGLALGVASGVPMGLLSYAWLHDLRLAAAIMAAMVVNGLVAVLMGMMIPIAFAKVGKDPALGTDEITTALSDSLSLLIYFLVATLILL